MATRELFPVQLYSEKVSPKCPHCALPDMERADIMLCKAPMPCDMMDELANNGWNRIGDILFKMKLKEICCPTHTARIPVIEFNSHKKLLRKWKRFLLYGDPKWDDCKSPTISEANGSKIESDREGGPENKTDVGLPMPKETDHEAEHNKRKKPFHKYFDEYEAELLSSTPKHRLEMKLVRCSNPESPIISETIADMFQIYCAHMKEVFPDKETYSNTSEFYSGFIKSPLVSSHEDEDRPMGTYHLQLYIDGKLQGFEVVDILTTSVTPIQFYCNPKLRFMKPSHYSSLWFIAFAQRLQKRYTEMTYYVIGPYNIFTTKASYKAEFKPLEVLCPITNTYVPVEKANPLLEKAKYTKLVDESIENIPDEEEMDIDHLSCCYYPHFGPTLFCDIPMEAQKKYLKPHLQHYLHEVGANIMNRMLIIIDDSLKLKFKKHIC